MMDGRKPAAVWCKIDEKATATIILIAMSLQIAHINDNADGVFDKYLKKAWD